MGYCIKFGRPRSNGVGVVPKNCECCTPPLGLGQLVLPSAGAADSAGHLRRPRVSGCCGASVEQSAATHQGRIITAVSFRRQKKAHFFRLSYN